MNLYRQNTKQSKRKLYAATILAIVLFLGDLLSGGSVRSLVHGITSSVWSVGTTAGHAISQSGFFNSRASLATTNQSLQKQVAQYQQDAAAYTALQSENKSLRALVHLAATTPGVTAPITSSTNASPYGTFLIGAGAAQGVKVGSLVVTSDTFVVGKVTSVENNQSTVTELFAPHSTVAAKIDTSDVVLEGWGGGNARTTVLHGVTVAVGDPVVVPSFGGRSVGVVGKVIEDPSSASVVVLVYLPVNLSSLDYVYVVNQ